MFTYAIYNFILFGSTLAAYLYEKSESKNAQMIFYGAAFLIPFSFLTLRYNIGNDYQDYVNYFYRIAGGEIVPKEPGYILVNYLIAYFDLDVQWLFVFFGFFFMYFAFKTFPKEGFALSVFLFISIMYLYEGFSAIRQGLVIAMLTYVLHQIGKRKFRYYLLWVGIASLFHLVTAFLFLIAYPMIKIKLNKFVAIFAILTLFVAVQFTHIAEYIFSMTAAIFPKYAWYLNNMQYAGAAKTSFGLLGPIIKIVIALPIIYAQDNILKKFPNALPIINFSMLYIVSYIFHLKISIFGRVEHAFVFAYIIAIVYFVYTFRSYSRLFIISLIGLFYYLMFMRYIANGTLEIDNDVYINPYQTVLFNRE
jgi:hypothetical protein